MDLATSEGPEWGFPRLRSRTPACCGGYSEPAKSRALAVPVRSQWHRLAGRHQVGQACCRRGGVAGAEPPHKGGPNRPDRPELQWSVVSGRWSVVRDRTWRAWVVEGADWYWFGLMLEDWW